MGVVGHRLVNGADAEDRKKHDWQEGSDGQRHGFRHPPNCHPQGNGGDGHGRLRQALRQRQDKHPGCHQRPGEHCRRLDGLLGVLNPPRRSFGHSSENPCNVTPAL